MIVLEFLLGLKGDTMNTWELTTQLQSETFLAVVLSISFCCCLRSRVIKVASARNENFLMISLSGFLTAIKTCVVINMNILQANLFMALLFYREGFNKNIARGTTDPEIDFVTNFGNHMAPIALAANLTTRWRHLC